MQNSYQRPQAEVLKGRLREPPERMWAVTGPRQVGKTTLVQSALPARHATYVAADQAASGGDWTSGLSDWASGLSGPTAAMPGSPATATWLVEQWGRARARARTLPAGQWHVLAIDEVQKIPRWSEIVKGLWDADRAQGVPLHVVLLGSSPWLVQAGLRESLTGRYETIHLTHWTYSEMSAAFDFSLDEYIYFGGYPGAARLIRDEPRWRSYVREALIQPSLEVDLLLMRRIDKPAVLKQLFELGCGSYSGQIVALSKILSGIEGAGHVMTIKEYLRLLSNAEMLTGLQKYAVQAVRQRAAAPKFNAHNTALISAQSKYTFEEAQRDRSHWGRLVESAVGAHLLNQKPAHVELHYWREGAQEVDFVLTSGDRMRAIEVKSGDKHPSPQGLAEFIRKYQQAKPVLIGGRHGVGLADFLLQAVEHWFD